jgi:hypothetical protein
MRFIDGYLSCESFLWKELRQNGCCQKMKTRIKTCCKRKCNQSILESDAKVIVTIGAGDIGELVGSKNGIV